MASAAKWGAWLLGACALVLAAWLGVNATDEPLSDEARALMAVPPPLPPERNNGFLDYLVLAAPADVPTYEAGLERLRALNNQPADAAELPPTPWAGFTRDPRVPRCAFGAAEGERPDGPCFEAALDPGVAAALRDHAALLGRYRAMRAQPRFVNLLQFKSIEQPIPAYQEMLEAQRLVLYEAARAIDAGDGFGAVRELERDAAFYRRMAASAVSLIDKMIAFAALDRIALFTAEVARRLPRSEVRLWRRLEALTGPLTREELDVVPSLRGGYADTLRWMQARSYLRVSDAVYEGLRYVDGSKFRPWWDPLAPYLYRPHQTANWFAGQCRVFLLLAERPSSEVFAALGAAREQARALEPGPVARVIFNPAGWHHPVIDGCDGTDYVIRMHGRAGVQSLAQLVVKLRAAGLSKPDEVATALAGALGDAHRDPFTGRPMRFDASNRTVGFDALNTHLSGVARPLRNRYGRMALPL